MPTSEIKIRGFEVVELQYRQHIDVQIKLPKRSSRHSAGYDFYTPTGFILCAGEKIALVTDIKCFMPQDEYLSIYIRSSVGMRSIMITNTVGIVDSDFYSNSENDGNILIHLHNLGKEIFEAEEGDRIAQGIFCKYLLVDGDNFESGDTRQGGQGHSGR